MSWIFWKIEKSISDQNRDITQRDMDINVLGPLRVTGVTGVPPHPLTFVHRAQGGLARTVTNLTSRPMKTFRTWPVIWSTAS